MNIMDDTICFTINWERLNSAVDLKNTYYLSSIEQSVL